MKLLRNLLIASSLCLLTAHGSADDGERTDPATLTVSGQATIDLPADQVRMSAGVEATSAKVDEAHAEATASMDRLVNAMKKLGLKPRQEFVIDQYTVDPQWTPRPRNADANWRPAIVGYKVTSSMQIKTKQIKLAGKMIAKAIDAGANDIGDLVFDLADPRTSRSEAIAKATSHAMNDARELAAAAGVTLVKIQTLSLDGISATPMYQKLGINMRRGGPEADMMFSGAAAPPVMSGNVTVQASVRLTWIIEGP